MNAVDLIRTKRDGGELSKPMLAHFIHGAATLDGWTDYQLTAMLMAMFCRGMTAAETTHLTELMTDSGERIDLSSLPGIKVDKHSTGGVGDKTSLIIAPLVAACGVVVPMMSGRGLGHTGGTLDKLEAIPGFRTHLTIDEFRHVLAHVGTAMISQTPQVAPADKRLYALRDVTATVESLPLITSSILSKKLAEGISALVLDVKFGDGAFMKDYDAARTLARSLVTVGTANGLHVEAVLTDMNAPLGCEVGNLNEVHEAVRVLRGEVTGLLLELSLRLGAMMLCLAGVQTSIDAAEARLRQALQDGSGLAKFEELVVAQGGQLDKLYTRFETYAQSQQETVYSAPESGYVVAIQAETIGRAAVALGAGRFRAEDSIDPFAGITLLVEVGMIVEQGQPLARLRCRPGCDPAEAVALVRSAFQLGQHPPQLQPLIQETIRYEPGSD